MKPTPAMIKALRLIHSYDRVCSLRLRADTRTALEKRGLIQPTPETRYFDCDWMKLWHLTDAGRRVLAEHTTGDE